MLTINKKLPKLLLLFVVVSAIPIIFVLATWQPSSLLEILKPVEEYQGLLNLVSITLILSYNILAISLIIHTSLVSNLKFRGTFIIGLVWIFMMMFTILFSSTMFDYTNTLSESVNFINLYFVLVTILVPIISGSIVGATAGFVKFRIQKSKNMRSLFSKLKIIVTLDILVLIISIIGYFIVYPLAYTPFVMN